MYSLARLQPSSSDVVRRRGPRPALLACVLVMVIWSRELLDVRYRSCRAAVVRLILTLTFACAQAFAVARGQGRPGLGVASAAVSQSDRGRALGRWHCWRRSTVGVGETTRMMASPPGLHRSKQPCKSLRGNPITHGRHGTHHAVPHTLARGHGAKERCAACPEQRNFCRRAAREEHSGATCLVLTYHWPCASDHTMRQIVSSCAVLLQIPPPNWQVRKPLCCACELLNVAC